MDQDQFRMIMRSPKRKLSQPSIRSTLSHNGTRVFSIESNNESNLKDNEPTDHNLPSRLKVDRNFLRLNSALERTNKPQSASPVKSKEDKSFSVSNPKIFKRLVSLRDAESSRNQTNISQMLIRDSTTSESTLSCYEENSLNNSESIQFRMRPRMKTLKLNSKQNKLYDIKEDESIEPEDNFFQVKIHEKNEDNNEEIKSKVQKYQRRHVRKFSISPEDESRGYQYKSPGKDSCIKEIVRIQSSADIKIRVRGRTTSSHKNTGKMDSEIKAEEIEKKNPQNLFPNDKKMKNSKQERSSRWTWKGAHGIIVS
ncbi:unnamed protein product [Blepharisma stoltei]|uniref:Uncharacterized protein n=1 Tax=Blepharisma stoltei TaxID=1481888 RepID=A0AAU9IAU4_9CILI|nr:unnamed protein product [Blepharisma stoltei]